MVDAAIRRAGMLRVDTLQALFTAAETLARLHHRGPQQLTIMTNGGGAAVMAADAAAALGVELATPGPALLAQLDAVLPANWPRANPVDIIGDAPVERYTAALQALLASPDTGTLLFAHAPTAIVRSEDIARACVPLLREAAGRVMSCWLGDGAVAAARQMFEDAGIANFATPEEAVQAFALLQTYRRNQELLLEAPAASENAVPDVAAAQALLAQAVAEGREWLSEHEAKAVLAAYGVPVVRTLTVGPSPAEAAQAAQSLGFPVVLKILSPQITHKTEVSGVRLDLPDAAAVARTRVARLLAGYRDHPPAQADALHDTLVAVSQMLADLPQLAELDINPLWADEHGVLALDARIRVSRQPVAGAERFAILPYPAQWVRTLQWQGRPITVRPIRPEDEDQHRRFIERLAPEDIRLRIFQTRRELPRSELARLTQIDYEREMAFIAVGTDAQGRPETLGAARAVRDPDNTEAEFAIIVRSDLKGRGLGHLLLQHLIDYVRSRGTPELVGLILRENSAMLQLARSVGFERDADDLPGRDGGDVVRVVLNLQQ